MWRLGQATPEGARVHIVMLGELIICFKQEYKTAVAGNPFFAIDVAFIVPLALVFSYPFCRPISFSVVLLNNSSPSGVRRT